MNERTGPSGSHPAPPMVIYEDEQLLAVNKPPGWSVGTSNRFDGIGVHAWLRERESRWTELEPVGHAEARSSGLLLFTKTTAARQALAGMVRDRPATGSSPHHVAELRFRHPLTGADLHLAVGPLPPPDPTLALRQAIIDPSQTTAFRRFHGEEPGLAGWSVDRLGEYLLSHAGESLSSLQRARLEGLREEGEVRGIYHRRLTRQIDPSHDPSPSNVWGARAPDAFEVTENGVRYELSLVQGYSTGLFLDQRDNRRRLLTGHVGPGFELPRDSGRPAEVLNTFAYTCAFSLCAAAAGDHVTSLDLSRKYLEWGKRNFALNGISATEHDFIYGDVFDWLRRFARRSRRFDLILLDPPTFSRSRDAGTFRAERDYGRLVQAALSVLNEGGVLFCSTNAARLAPDGFVETIERSVKGAGRQVLRKDFVPQPPDFPVSREEPAYLKTIWLRIG